MFWSVVSITQILSVAGIAADVNLMVWMYGSAAGGVISLIVGLIQMYAYDLMYTAKTQDSPAGANDAKIAAATKVVKSMELDWIKMTAGEVITGLELEKEGMNWLAAQMMQLPMEKKEEMEEEMKEEDGDMPKLFMKAAFNYMF